MRPFFRKGVKAAGNQKARHITTKSIHLLVYLNHSRFARNISLHLRPKTRIPTAAIQLPSTLNPTRIQGACSRRTHPIP